MTYRPQQPTPRSPPPAEMKFDPMPAIIGPVAGVVTILLHTIGFPPLFIGTILALVGLYYAYKERINVELLFSLLCRSIVHVFFRESQSRNAHRIPSTGPVIFICAPHNNQFLDPAVVQEFSHRPISWLIAAKSYRDPTIGKFARAQRAIPVERPQDLAKPGIGKIFHKGNPPITNQSTQSLAATDAHEDHPNHEYLLTIDGNSETNFLRDFTDQVEPKNKTNSIGIAGEIYPIAKVIDEHTLILKSSTESFPPVHISPNASLGYKIVPKVDQHDMFHHVWSTLSQGNAVGIFPEGGSHDRTELLPLKAGVAIMALGAAAQILDQYEEDCKKQGITAIDYSGISKISLVAVGLNYFHGHRFRGRVYVEYGDPFYVPHELVLQFKKGGGDKINACNSLLDIIRDQLKSVTVSAPSWAQLQVLWAVRRLYQPSGLKLPPKLVVVLIRRFAEGYELVKDRDDVQQVVTEVEQYNETLKYYGLRDHQVNITQQSRTGALLKLLLRAVLLFILTILAIPGSILNIPILLITRFISRKKAREALKSSTVKVAARDVIGSWKVLTSLTVVPLVLCINPLIIATAFSNFWPWLTIWGNFVILQPVMMWASVILLEKGGVIFKSLKPLWFAAFPADSTLAHYASVIRPTASSSSANPELHPHIYELRQSRARLRQKIRSLVDILGPLIYGPAFNQLRIFPSQGQPQNFASDNSLASLDDLQVIQPPSFDQQKSAKAAQPRDTNSFIPALIPQLSDLSDTDGGSTPIFAASPRPSSTVISEGEDLNNNEFTLNSEGEYKFNHEKQNKIKELQISASALELFLSSRPTPSNNNDTSTSSLDSKGRLSSRQSSSKRESLLSDDDDDGEMTCQEETMLVDGLQLNARYQSLLFSRSLQPITPSVADSISLGSIQDSLSVGSGHQTTSVIDDENDSTPPGTNSSSASQLDTLVYRG